MEPDSNASCSILWYETVLHDVKAVLAKQQPRAKSATLLNMEPRSNQTSVSDPDI
jgi:hypothetical protein